MVLRVTLYNDFQNTAKDNSKTLDFERQLVKLLYINKYDDVGTEKHANMLKIGKEIMTKCENIRLRKICTLVLVNDVLRDNSNMTLDSAINALKPFTFSSATAAHLMSFLYIKKNEYYIALEYLYKALSTTKSCCQQQYLDILSNIACCFAMLGEPHPVEELLLHWISMHDATNIKETVPVNSVSLYLESSEQKPSTENKRSILWMLLYASELVGDIGTSKAVVHVLNNDR